MLIDDSCLPHSRVRKIGGVSDLDVVHTKRVTHLKQLFITLRSVNHYVIKRKLLRLLFGFFNNFLLNQFVQFAELFLEKSDCIR